MLATDFGSPIGFARACQKDEREARVGPSSRLSSASIVRELLRVRIRRGVPVAAFCILRPWRRMASTTRSEGSN